MRRNNAGLLFVILVEFLTVFIIGIITYLRQLASEKAEFSEKAKIQPSRIKQV